MIYNIPLLIQNITFLENQVIKYFFKDFYFNSQFSSIFK